MQTWGNEMTTYWEIFAAEFLSDMGIQLTDEQVKELADGIEGGIENQSLACGWDCIPNPDRLEIERLQKEIKELRREAERAEDTWREAMAVGCGVRQSELYREGNRIKVSVGMR